MRSWIFTHVALIVLSLLTLACSGTSGDKVTFISGRAQYPVAGVLGRDEVPLDSARLVFDDFTPLTQRQASTTRTNPFLGTTMPDGSFSVSIEDTRLVVLSAELLQNDRLLIAEAFVLTDGTQKSKNITGVTTLASAALRLALEEQRITLDTITEELILSFEQNALDVGFNMAVDLEEEDQVEAASIEIVDRLLPAAMQPEEEDDDLEGNAPEQLQLELSQASLFYEHNNSTDACPDTLPTIELRVRQIDSLAAAENETITVSGIPEPLLTGPSMLLTDAQGEATFTMTYTCEEPIPSTGVSADILFTSESGANATLSLELQASTSSF